MKTHTFKYQEIINGKKIYMVKCRLNAGEFSTKMWLDRTCKNNYCPCCGEKIK